MNSGTSLTYAILMELGSCRSRHRLFDHSSKGDHDWAKETLEISGEWKSDSSLKLRVLTTFITSK